jgi:hypothetical protein
MIARVVSPFLALVLAIARPLLAGFAVHTCRQKFAGLRAYDPGRVQLDTSVLLSLDGTGRSSWRDYNPLLFQAVSSGGPRVMRNSHGAAWV